jgi:hypothetical protein
VTVNRSTRSGIKRFEIERSHLGSGGYTLTEVALTMPAVAILLLACIGSLHSSAKLLQGRTQPLDADILVMLAVRRNLSSCIVALTETADGFSLYDRWGRRLAPRRLVRETADLSFLSFDIDDQYSGHEPPRVNSVVALVRCSIGGEVEVFRIPTRLASPYEAEFLEQYGLHTIP